MKEANFEGMVRRAITDYGMISAGDRICVGVSGGKDSVACLRALAALREYSPVPFDLYAVTLDLGIGPVDYTPLRSLCDTLGIPFAVEDTRIGNLVFHVREEKKPCSLCANLRRGALVTKALSLGCSKVALGHNRDDAVETLAMSLFYEGRLHCFSPVTYMSRRRIHVIRPILYAAESDALAYCVKHSLPILPSPCPMAGRTHRAAMRRMLDDLAETEGNIRGRMFTALKESGICGWKSTAASDPAEPSGE